MKFKKRFISSFLALGLATSSLFISSAATTAPQMKIHFINVGQGDAIYIKAPYGEDILIDGGDEAYGKTVVDYLKKQGVKDIEHLIATHSDSDHVGGLDDVLNAFPVKKVYYPGDATKNTRAFNNFVNATNKEKGCSQEYSAQKINNRNLGIKGITAKFIQSNKDYKDVNDDSLVLFIDYKNTEVLLTGDLATESELDMVNKNLIPDIDVLKIAHHGSKYATSNNFLKKSTPQYSVISVGQNNYGHPNGDVLSRLKTVKSSVYRTDQSGNVVMNTDGSKISFTTSKAYTPAPPASTKPVTKPSTPTPTKPVAKTVYTTKTGTKYHYSKSCRGLSNANTIYTSILTDAQNKGLTLCGYED